MPSNAYVYNLLRKGIMTVTAIACPLVINLKKVLPGEVDLWFSFQQFRFLLSPHLLVQHCGIVTSVTFFILLFLRMYAGAINENERFHWNYWILF